MHRYLIPADAIPGLLDGWTGPGSLPDGEPVVGLPGEHWGGRTLCGDGVLRHYTERSIRLDPARPEVAHRIADVLRSLGHEVRALLPRALGGEVYDLDEVLDEGRLSCGCPNGCDERAAFTHWDGAERCPKCMYPVTGYFVVRPETPASEVSAALLAASVAGVVAGRGVVRGVLEWVLVPVRDTDPAWQRWELRYAGRDTFVAVAVVGPGIDERADVWAPWSHEWALLSPDAPSGVVVPTWGAK